MNVLLYYCTIVNLEYGGLFMKKDLSPTTSWNGLLYPLLTYDKLGIKARIICYVDTDRGDGSDIHETWFVFS